MNVRVLLVDDHDLVRQGLVRAFERAIFLEDANAYFEPPLWHQPARLSLGALLLKQKRFAEAEIVFREDLKRNRGNGWSLYGLARSLKAQQKPSADVEAQFQAAWAHADVTLPNTTF